MGGHRRSRLDIYRQDEQGRTQRLCCGPCAKWKTEDAFHKAGDYLQAKCKDCAKAAARESYASKKAEAKAEPHLYRDAMTYKP